MIMIMDFGQADRYELLDLDGIVSDYEGNNENNWSESMYNLATREIERLKNIVGDEIDNTKEENSDVSNQVKENVVNE